MMNYKLLFHTIRHLRPKQVFYQLWYRFYKPSYQAVEAPLCQIPKLQTAPITRFRSLDGNVFTFLNLSHDFAGWDFTDNGMLWAYNQNYFDFINQEGITEEDGCKWIDRFIEELPSNKVGLDPYPIALRSINWIKFFCRYPESATKPRLDSLYSQVKLLAKKLEYHLLANHLLEDAYALYIAAAFFQDSPLQNKATKLLLAQLKEQTLSDGAHYEQSPMYHCILLDRLLDCINIVESLEFRVESQFRVDSLKYFASQMLGHLEGVIWEDGNIPLLNDAAYGIAPMPVDIFDYAKRLDIKWEAIPMTECGYRKMKNGRLEAIVDVGNITATYQPGHTHADTFNYELRIDGKPFVVDTGISTYNKNERRQLERSTIAHNCVSPDERNSSEVWDGFRVGRRCRAVVSDHNNIIEASHNGFGKECGRRFTMTEEAFTVEDWYGGAAVSYVHLSEGTDASRIRVEGAEKVDIKPWKYSTEYNSFHAGTVMEIHFNGHLSYTIQ